MDATVSPCVMSGHCCLARPCVYGEAGTNGVCRFLGAPNDIGQRPCLKYDEIVASEKDKPEILQMMGKGCSSTLFNTKRNRVLLALRQP